jgi:acetyl-CoA acetyltransferase
MRSVSIVATGITPFGKHLDESVTQIGRQAALHALVEGGMKPSEIEIGFFANCVAARIFGEVTMGQNVLWEVGINKIPVVNVENACTSSSSAFHMAWLSVASGHYDTAIVLGAEKLYVPEVGLLDSGESQWDTRLGFVVPAGFALRAKRHMHEYGTTPEQLASVSVKNRKHGSLNPIAQFKDPITIDDVLNAPMICDPLTRLSCCPIGDGAAAIILCATSNARRYTSKPIEIRSSVLVTGAYENPSTLIPWETDVRGCRVAYEKAGLGPDDIDVAECHDAFTIAEILHYEALGFCPIGEGGRLAISGETSLGGKHPVNVSGGLLSKGHPLGATGVAQIIEIVYQLRGEAGARQVDGAKVGLAHCMGGDKDGDGKSCTVNILSA